MKPLRPVRPRIPAEMPAMDASDVRLKKKKIFKLYVIINSQQMEIKIQLCTKDTVRPVTLYTTCSYEA